MLVNNLWQILCDSPRTSKKNNNDKKNGAECPTSEKQSSSTMTSHSQPSSPLTMAGMRLVPRKKTSLGNLTPDDHLRRIDNFLDKEYSTIGVRTIRTLLEQAANDPHPHNSPVGHQLAQQYMPDREDYDYILGCLKEYYEELGGEQLGFYNRVAVYRNDLRTVKIKLTEIKMHSQLIEIERKVSMIEILPEPSAAGLKGSASSPEFYNDANASRHLVCG